MWRGTCLLNPKPPNLVAQTTPVRLSTQRVPRTYHAGQNRGSENWGVLAT